LGFTVRRLRLAVLLVVALAGAPAAAAEVFYSYDELGRLRSVTDEAGETAEYVYDDLGNITAIRRYGADAVAVVEFSPRRGTPGMAVTIFGSGFGAAPADNVVRFNGTEATVVAATPTQLQVTVPPGATTGPVSVQSPKGLASSGEPFEITDPASLPTIAAFAPTIGAPGTQVTITGTNFDPRPGLTRVDFNQTQAVVAGVTPTSLTATVPAEAGSGKVRVVTPAGAATSSEDFIIPPPGVDPADILVVRRAVVDGLSPTLNISVPSKGALLLFDGVRGRYLTVDLVGLTLNPSNSSVAYQVRDPRGLMIASGSATSSARSIHLPELPINGTYSVYFNVGANTAALTVSVVTNQTLAADGPEAGETIMFPGQSKRLVFSGTASSALGLGIVPGTLSSSTVTVYRPDGGVLGTQSFCSGCAFSLANLPVTGTYSVLVAPSGTASGSFTAVLSTDATSALTVDGASNDVVLRPGQRARLLFEGAPGQNLGLGLANVTVNALITAYQPNGAVLPSANNVSCVASAGCTVTLGDLPAAGTYTVIVVPTSAFGGGPRGFSASLSSDVAGSLAVDGASLEVAITRPGQQARLAFTGTAGQNIGLGITNMALPSPGTYNATISVYRPSGALLYSNPNCYAAYMGCIVSLANLPESGAYSIVVTPASTKTGVFTATLSNDVAAELPIDGGPTNIALSRPGQQARLSFSGTAGQNLAIGIGSIAMPNLSEATVQVYQPNGQLFGWVYPSCWIPSGSCAIALSSLPASGTYTLVFAPMFRPATGSFSASLSSDVTANLVVDGPTAPINLAHPGQRARITFSGTAGQSVSLGLTDMAVTGTQWLSIAAFHPNGNLLTSTGSCQVANGPCVFATGTLPVSGIYTLLVTVGGDGRGSFTAAVFGDVTVPLTIDGAPTGVSLARPGQRAKLTFEATAGQAVSIGLGDVVLNGATSFTLNAYQPNGTYLGSSTCQPSGLGCSLDMSGLPVSGTYSVVTQPPWNAAPTSSFTATLSSPATSALAVNGAPASIAIGRAGQAARLTFAATAGQSVALTIANLNLAGVTYVSVRGLRPDGVTQVGSLTNCAAATGCTVTLGNLPVSGTYSFVVAPNATPGTGTFDATLVGDVSAALAVDGDPANVALTGAGQQATFTFAATAGQSVSVGITNLNLSGGANATLRLFNPGGTLITQLTCAAADGGCSATTGTPAATVSGTYTAVVTPSNSATGTFTGMASRDVSAALELDGDPLALSLPRAGQHIRLTFGAGPNMTIGLGLSAFSLTGASAYSITVTGPTGGFVTQSTCYIANGGCNVMFNGHAVSGTHTLTLAPIGAPSGSFVATLSREIAATLPIDGPPMPITASRAGQPIRLSFFGSVGQNLGLRIGNLSLTGGTSAYVEIRPVQIYNDYYGTTCSAAEGGCSYPIPELHANGTYTITITPQNGATGSFDVSLISSAMAAIAVDGPPVTLGITRAGQDGRFPFTGLNQHLFFTVSDLNLGGAGATVRWRSSSGSGGTTTNCAAGAPCTLELGASNVPRVVIVTPVNGAIGNVTGTLYSRDVPGTLTVDAPPASFSIPRFGQQAVITFSGTAGQALNLALSNLNVAGGNNLVVRAFLPDGNFLVGGVACPATGACNISLGALPASGTYRLQFTPNNSATATFSASVAGDVQAALTVDGSPTNVTIPNAGQRARLSFSAVAGQNLGLGLTNLSFTGPGSASVQILQPSGGPYINTSCSAAVNCGIALNNLPFTGTYTAIVTPSGNGTGSLTATLSSDVTGSIIVEGAPTSVSIGRAGQQARLSFSGSAGQFLTLNVGAVNLSDAGYAAVSVYQPNGAHIGGATCFAAGCSVGLSNLPVSGTYTILVSPANGATGSLNAALVSDVSAVLAVDGSSLGVTITRPGQQARLTFSGAAGQTLGVGLSNLALSTGSTSAFVSVTRPDGVAMPNKECFVAGGACGLDIANLPMSGTYVISVAPANGGTGSFTAILSSAIEMGALTLEGAAIAASTSRIGQPVRFTYEAPAGGSVVFGIVRSAGATSDFRLLNPAGGNMGAWACGDLAGCRQGSFDNLVAGVYSVIVTPNGTASFSARAFNDIVGTLMVGAPAQSFATVHPWQEVRLTFEGTAGTMPYLSMSGVSLNPASTTSTVAIEVRRPDGVLLAQNFCNAPNGCRPTWSLPVNGYYSVRVIPPATALAVHTGSFTLRLSSPAQPIDIDGATFNGLLALRGLTFNATAGERLSLGIAPITLSGVPAIDVTLVDPSNAPIATASCAPANGGCTLEPGTLSANGAYYIDFAIPFGSGGTFSATLSRAVAGAALSVGGAAVNYSSSRPGQNVRFTFQGTSGQNLGLGVRPLTVNPSSPGIATVRIDRPDGTPLTSSACTTAAGGCGLNLAGLPASGTYAVTVAPQNGASQSFTARLSADLTGTLPLNSNRSVNLSRIGQNGRYTFSGSAGQTRRIQVTAQTTSPTGRSVTYTVLRPNGTTHLTQTVTGASATLMLGSLPTTGTYSVIIDPTGGETATMTLRYTN
jgi:large repetitive protein